jgi:hypothetical protein
MVFVNNARVSDTGVVIPVDVVPPGEFIVKDLARRLPLLSNDIAAFQVIVSPGLPELAVNQRKRPSRVSNRVAYALFLYFQTV